LNENVKAGVEVGNYQHLSIPDEDEASS